MASLVCTMIVLLLKDRRITSEGTSGKAMNKVLATAIKNIIDTCGRYALCYYGVTWSSVSVFDTAFLYTERKLSKGPAKE